MEDEGQSESVTQLADTQPQIDTPLRILLPSSTNAPPRTQGTCRDEHIGTNVFSPGAYAATLNLADVSVGPNTRIPSLGGLAKGNPDNQAHIKTAISHYTVLAFSSHRAGKKEVEASAYVSLAVIYDNLGNYKSAIENYKHYLTICKETGDLHGQAVACNCLGVDYMYLACPSSDEGFINGFKATDQALADLELALQFHQQHLQIADQGGKFVANNNIGLCLGAKNEYTQAAKYYQNSLRVAIKMQTLFGQSIAVGNLGMLAISKGDYPTARTCLEQHLQLVQSLQDVEGEVNAWKLLATLCTKQENYSGALEFLDHARRISLKNGYHNELRRILCLMGMAKGNLTFPNFTDTILSSLEENEEY